MHNRTSIPGVPHHETPATRRDFLARSGGGFGALAMAYLLSGQPLRAGDAAGTLERIVGKPKASPNLSSLAARGQHYAPRAKSVVVLFMEGAPSHIDLADP